MAVPTPKSGMEDPFLYTAGLNLVFWLTLLDSTNFFQRQILTNVGESQYEWCLLPHLSMLEWSAHFSILRGFL